MLVSRQKEKDNLFEKTRICLVVSMLAGGQVNRIGSIVA
jgi:hypothetical protein